MKRSIFALLVLALLLTFKSAYANVDRFSVVNFHLAPDGGEYFTTISSTSLYQLQWNAGTALDFAYTPLVEKSTDRDIIKYYLMQHFYGAIGITDWLSFGLELPVAWINRFSDPDVAAAPLENKLALSDPRFQFKVRILDRARYPVGMAFTPFMTAPLGKKSQFLGDDGITGGGILTVDAEFKRRLWLALNAGMQVHKAVTWRNVDLNPYSVLLGAGASVRASDAFIVALDFNTKTPTNHFFTDKADTPTEIVGGVKYNVGKTGLQIQAGGGVGLVRGVGGPTARGFAGLSYKSFNERTVTLDEERYQEKYVELKSKEQKEIDMVIALRDKCPKDPAKFRSGIDDEGCPKYYEMKEVADLIAECPTKAENFDPTMHSEMCNKVYTLTDKYSRTDAEAIFVLSTADLAGKCPLNPADFSPKVHDAGCPKYYELKEVTPLIAKCPSNPKKFNPKVDDEACPKVYELQDSYQEENWMTIARLAKKDTDGDGVPDVDDKCPAIFGPVKNGGCPTKQKPQPYNADIKVEGNELVTRVPITFKFNSYEITDESAQALGELAEKLIADPTLRNIRIEGYADPVGERITNKVYSKRRAEAVENYLKLHGVDTSNMKITPYGSTTKFEGGYRANRRVIFLLEK